MNIRVTSGSIAIAIEPSVVQTEKDCLNTAIIAPTGVIDNSFISLSNYFFTHSTCKR